MNPRLKKWILPLFLLAQFVLFTGISNPHFGSASGVAVYLKNYFSDIFAQSTPLLLEYCSVSSMGLLWPG